MRRPQHISLNSWSASLFEEVGWKFCLTRSWCSWRQSPLTPRPRQNGHSAQPQLPFLSLLGFSSLFSKPIPRIYKTATQQLPLSWTRLRSVFTRDRGTQTIHRPQELYFRVFDVMFVFIPRYHRHSPKHALSPGADSCFESKSGNQKMEPPHIEDGTPVSSKRYSICMYSSDVIWVRPSRKTPNNKTMKCFITSPCKDNSARPNNK